MLEEIFNIGVCDRRVRLAVIDGLPDICSAPLAGAGLVIADEMVPEGLDEPDPHGTEICSLIFGRSADHVGLAAGCGGLALPVFFKRRDGVRTASQVAIAHAITVAVERGASIINISAGQLVSAPEIGQHLENALRLCRERRVLVVAAASRRPVVKPTSTPGMAPVMVLPAVPAPAAQMPAPVRAERRKAP